MDKGLTVKIAKAMGAVGGDVRKTGQTVTQSLSKIMSDEVSRAEQSRRDEAEAERNLFRNSYSFERK